MNDKLRETPKAVKIETTITTTAVMKLCTKCQQEKGLDAFSPSGKRRKDGTVILKSQCKSCRVQLAEKRRQANLEKMSMKSKEYYKKKKKDINDRCRRYYSDNADALRAQKRGYYKDHRGSISEYHQKRKPERNAYLRHRRRVNPTFRLMCSIRARISAVLKDLKTKKGLDYLGCDRPFFYKWMESQMVNGMSWDNYGSAWHADHVRPISCFDILNPNEQNACFNWRNYRPLWKIDNLEKSAKMPTENELVVHNQLADMFLLEYQG